MKNGLSIFHAIDTGCLVDFIFSMPLSGIKDTEVEMKKGDTMFVPRGEVHWFYNPFPEPVEMLFAYTRPTLGSAGYKIVE